MPTHKPRLAVSVTTYLAFYIIIQSACKGVLLAIGVSIHCYWFCKSCIQDRMFLIVKIKFKPRAAVVRTAFNTKFFFTSKLDLILRQKLVKSYILSIALYGAENWTLQKADQKYLERSETWCRRRMKKISWINSMKNEEVKIREGQECSTKIERKNPNWICHI